ncbi:MAG: isoleucine--tRNA ligase [Cytophagales bacterium]|nr:isoleucine--tRNA ligase [Cytophagales bacterium]
MKYRENKNLKLSQVGVDILAHWKKNNIFEASLENREGKQEYTFYEGPPSANGTPGIHHVIARAVKDIFCRYKTLKGFKVERKGGWDTHGLPVELQVEKQLGITKEDIGKKISIEEYNQKCREAVMQYKSEWDDLTEKMGYWVDLEDPYITFDKKYMETLWHLLKKFYDKGLLYKGYTIQPYSPAAGSGLSSHELNQPGAYRDVKDTSLVAQFKIKGTENDYFLAWTTTPWTLPANNSLAVGDYINYVKVRTFNQYTFKPVNVILAADLVQKYFNEKAENLSFDDYEAGDKLIPWRIVERYKGSDLIGMEYEQLLPYVPLSPPALTVLSGDFVSIEEGTGIVHLAKTFGADDYRVSEKNRVPGVLVKDDNGNGVPIVDKQGRFVKEITDFAGMYVKNYTGEDENDPNYRPTDVRIAIKLKEENKAFRVEKYVHSYPHCWRTDKPVLYYPMDSWFIRTTAYKKQLVEWNKTINWKPESTGSGRFGNWLENLVDWNLSRSRFWGTPLPIWRTEDGKEEKCIGSIAELREEVEKAVRAGFMEKQIPEAFDLHRPFVDEIYLASDSGRKMFREPDLIDVWFDSGAMPYAQWHYPFENREIFNKKYPADFIAEGVDQTRGWFFTLHTIAVMLYDRVAFKNVIANGLVLDKDGNKMSKRLGNAVDPFETIAEHGPDATRWYMISNANPWDNLKFDINGVVEVQRRFFGTLQNTYSFFALYANLDDFDWEEEQIPVENRTESDQWIISKLNSLVARVDAAYTDYEPTRAARAIQNFVIDDLSNWYVRLNRKRFWKGSLNDDKKAAYQSLHSCLKTVAQLAAPIAPFYADKLYLDLTCEGAYGSNSVHLTDFPVPDTSRINQDLEEKMNLSQSISSLVHSLRKQHKLKVRQPLSRILIPILDKKVKARIQAVEDIILNEVNIKGIEYVDNTSGIIVKKAKPNFRKLGQLYGPMMKDLSKRIANLDQESITRFEVDGELDFQVNGKDITLKDNDLFVQSEDIPGWSVATEGGITVALDITITDELQQEGIARDLVNRIQNLRKDLGLEVQDKIKVLVDDGNEIVTQSIKSNWDYICTETQALTLDVQESLQNYKELEIDSFVVKLSIEALKPN